MRANRFKILRALEWLQRNNPYYADLEIDFEALQAYPINDQDYVEGLSSVTVNASEDEREAATAYTEEEGHTGVTYTALPTKVPSATVREEVSRLVLGVPAAEGTTPQVEWPERSGGPVKETTPGFYSMAFPWLPGFCHGRCDITVPARPAGNPQYLAWLNHLVHHPSRAFARDPRFLLYTVNHHRRNKALTQGNVFVKYSCKDITVAALKEKVEAGNFDIFKKLLYFTRSTIGKSSICNQSHCRNRYFMVAQYQ